MKRIDEYIQRRRSQADFAERIFKNIELTNSLSDSELKIHSSSNEQLKNDVVFKILGFIKSGSEIYRAEITHKGRKMQVIDVLAPFYGDQLGFLDKLLESMRTRGMRKEDYEKISDLYFRVQLREVYRREYPYLSFENPLEIQKDLDNIFEVKSEQKADEPSSSEARRER